MCEQAVKRLDYRDLGPLSWVNLIHETSEMDGKKIEVVEICVLRVG
jgi:hypothetical protein